MKTNSSFWLGDETSLKERLKIEKKINQTSLADLGAMSTNFEDGDGEGEFGEYGYMVSRSENVAIVKISGSLTTRTRSYNRYMGVVSYDEIRNAVFAAMESNSSEAILLDMDTPGGSASGVSELSDFLAEVNRGVMPIYTYTGTAMASGGYWLGSVGRKIYASKLATVGSIGVITVHASFDKMLKERGIEVTVLRSGEFKALGSRYEKLDDKAKHQLQSQMDTIYDVFLETVAENRGTTVQSLKATAAEGRVFIGAGSVQVGLVDEISSFDAAVSAVSKKVRSSDRLTSNLNSVKNLGEIHMNTGKKKVLTDAAVALIESGVPKDEVFANPENLLEVDAGEAGSGEEGGESENQEDGAQASDADAGSDESSEGSEGSEDAQAGNAPDPKGSEDSGVFDKMFAKVSDLSMQVADLTSKLKVTERERDQASSTETELVKIAVNAINRMQINLGGAPMKLGDLGAQGVLDQYTRTYSAFNQRFKVGGTAQVPGEDDSSSNSAAAKENFSMAAAATRLTTGQNK